MHSFYMILFLKASTLVFVYLQVCNNSGERVERHLCGILQRGVPLRLAAQPRALATSRLAQVLIPQFVVRFWRWGGRGRGGKDAAGACVAAVPWPTTAHRFAHHVYRGRSFRAHFCQHKRLGQQHEQRAHRLCRYRFRAPPA